MSRGRSRPEEEENQRKETIGGRRPSLTSSKMGNDAACHSITDGGEDTTSPEKGTTRLAMAHRWR
jgi:hypothetical protein